MKPLANHADRTFGIGLMPKSNMRCCFLATRSRTRDRFWSSGDPLNMTDDGDVVRHAARSPIAEWWRVVGFAHWDTTGARNPSSVTGRRWWLEQRNRSGL